MIIKDKMCYSKLLWLYSNKKFMQSISKVTTDQPAYELEGMAGYIEVNVEFNVNNLSMFAQQMANYDKQPDDIKIEMYRTALGSRVTC